VEGLGDRSGPTDGSGRRRVVVTGLGWVTPLGHAVEPVWRRLLAGDSGVGRTTLFDAATFPTTFSAEVRDYRLCADVADVEPHRTAGRSTQFALGACAQAWRGAGLDRHRTLDRDRVGLYLSAGEGSLDFDAFTAAALSAWDATTQSVDVLKWAEVATARMDALRELEQEPHLALTHLAMLTGARGPAMNSMTACAAGAQAIGEATAILRRGDADVMVTGGAHSMIHPLGVTGFNRLTAMSEWPGDPAQASRPFDADRGGFVLGEGAGIVILETLEHATARGAPVLAEVLGYGSTADAYRITDQHPQSEGMIGAMRAALADARISPAAVGYVNAHGTGTKENDGHETLAIKTVFAGHPVPPVSSIKSMLGHFITAAGAVEFIACVLALRDRVLPPTINLDTPDPQCDLDYVPNVARATPGLDVVLSNNIGFGGQNDTLVIGRGRQHADSHVAAYASVGRSACGLGSGRDH
jgi:3-oxoacyl-[acyl-carrier-protein] synthase II